FRLAGNTEAFLAELQPVVPKIMRLDQQLKNASEAISAAEFHDRLKAFDQTLSELMATLESQSAALGTVSGSAAFVLSDTYGFPIDLTELMARERGMIVDIPRYKELMEQQRKRSQQSRVRHVVKLSEVEAKEATRFVGFD